MMTCNFETHCTSTCIDQLDDLADELLDGLIKDKRITDIAVYFNKKTYSFGWMFDCEPCLCSQLIAYASNVLTRVDKNKILDTPYLRLSPVTDS